MQELGRYSGLGLQFAFTMAAFALGGYWLDGKLGTLPLLLIVGTLLGSVGGSLAVIRKVPPPKARRPTESAPD